MKIKNQMHCKREVGLYLHLKNFPTQLPLVHFLKTHEMPSVRWQNNLILTRLYSDAYARTVFITHLVRLSATFRCRRFLPERKKTMIFFLFLPTCGDLSYNLMSTWL